MTAEWTMLFRQPSVDDGGFYAADLSGPTFRAAFLEWARDDLTEWFDSDTDWYAADDDKVITASLDTLSQTKVYPGHLPGSRRVTELLTQPPSPADKAAPETAQVLARHLLAPAQPVDQEVSTSAFICGMEHVRALVTAITERGLADGIDAEDIGQVLVDENYKAVNIRYGSDDDPPPYTHHRVYTDPWTTLKAADCYHYQVAEYHGYDTSAAYLAVGALRTALLDELGITGEATTGDYMRRPAWEHAPGWPVLDYKSPALRRAEGLIQRYQQLDGIETLDPSEWDQYIGDMIADLLHYANGREAMDPWAVLDRGVDHFVQEVRQERPQLQPRPATLRLLVATAEGQGQQEYDFCNTLDGEIVYPGPCDLPMPNHSCGCLESLVGVDTGRRTTTFTVAEVAITRSELHRVLAKAQNLTEDDPGYAAIPELAADMLAVASQFPIGAVLGRSHRRYRRRHTGASPSDPPTAGPDVPDAEDELKPWTVRVRTRRNHEFTVEASDEDSAMDAAWGSFDEDRNIVDHDTDVHVSLAA